MLAVAVAGVALSGCGTDDNPGDPDGHDAAQAAPDSAECAGRDTLTAAGSTAQQNAIALFNRAWVRRCPGKNVSYNPTGSGAGRMQFIAGHVDFTGSEAPLDGDQAAAAARRCGGNPAWHLPLVFGQIVLAYHLDGVDALVLNADVLARIFSGTVSHWDDPAIAALNPGAALPDTEIRPIYRSDSSGTTNNFQQYLMTTAPQAWASGAGSEFRGRAGEGAQKSAGVIQAVQMIPGAIGYVERGFIDRDGMRFAQIDSGSGAVPVTAGAARSTLESADFIQGTGHDLRLDLDSLYGTETVGAYPLVSVTYEIVCSKGYRPDVAAAVKSLMTVAAGSGQDGLPGAGYVSLPDKFKQRLVAAIAAIR